MSTKYNINCNSRFELGDSVYYNDNGEITKKQDNGVYFLGTVTSIDNDSFAVGMNGAVGTFYMEQPKNVFCEICGVYSSINNIKLIKLTSEKYQCEDCYKILENLGKN